MFCKAPFSSLCVTGDKFSVCCQHPFLDDEYDFNSANFKALRNELTNFVDKPSSKFERCVKCAINHSYEEFSVNSDNHLDNLFNLSPSNEIADHKISFFHIVFGNKCVCACKTCNSLNSSLYSKLYDGINNLVSVTPNYRKVIIEQAENLNYVTVIGGETFLYKEELEFLLEHLKLGTKLHLYTNAMVFDKELITKLMEKFEVKLQISIDGYGKNLEYVRVGTKSDVVFENAKQIIQLPMTSCIIYTTSVLNCFNMFDEISYIMETLNNHLIINVVVEPELYSVVHLPEYLKDKIREQIKLVKEKFVNTEKVSNINALEYVLDSKSKYSEMEAKELLKKDILHKDKSADFDTLDRLEKNIKEYLFGGDDNVL